VADSRTRLACFLGVLASCTALATPAAAAPGDLVALGVGANQNTLYRFSPGTPNTVASVPVTGLTPGTTLIGIDYRPANRVLYGMGVNGDVVSLFTIDPMTGAATPAGSATISSIVGATSFGVDFQPVSDRLRVVDNLASDGGGGNANNFRLTPEGKLAGMDSDVSYSELSGGAANAPLVAVAHDRNVAGATATTVFGIVSGGDRLVRLGGVDNTPSANAGTLYDIGSLGVNTSNNAGFDVSSITGAAFAVLEVAGVSGLYVVNLASGAATPVGAVGSGLVDFGGLAIEPLPPAVAPPPLLAPPPILALTSLSLAPQAFRAANIGGAILSARKRKAPVGATVTYDVTLPATVEFSVLRLRKGRKVGKRCLKATRANRKWRPCVLAPKPVKGSFSHSGAAGANSFKFTGRIGGKALLPGSYRLVGKAGAGTATRAAPFKVVR
jgi:hypothetical protein